MASVEASDGHGPVWAASDGKVPFVSTDGISQLDNFISILAMFNLHYCLIILSLGRAKMRCWTAWEREMRRWMASEMETTGEWQFTHEPQSLRSARESSFRHRHWNYWRKHPVPLCIASFFWQFSVPKVDYLTLRHGFINAHMAPYCQFKFDFQKYITRSLEEDFTVLVGISPQIRFFTVLFLLFKTHGWYYYLWQPFIPLIILLLVGTKLQVIITKMGLKIQGRGEVVKGVPVVMLGDDHFWFNSPRLILYLIHFVLFQNAFELAFLAWTWHEFGLRSCFHKHLEDVIIRILMGVLVQLLCGYVTLPLYALVTQMGSYVKHTIFDERVTTALRQWLHKARKHIKQNRVVTPESSNPTTPSHGMSHVHQSPHDRSNVDHLQTSPRMSNLDNDCWNRGGSPSPRNHRCDGSLSDQQDDHGREEHERETQEPSSTILLPPPPAIHTQHEIDIQWILDYSVELVSIITSLPDDDHPQQGL